MDDYMKIPLCLAFLLTGLWVLLQCYAPIYSGKDHEETEDAEEIIGKQVHIVFTNSAANCGPLKLLNPKEEQIKEFGCGVGYGEIRCGVSNDSLSYSLRAIDTFPGIVHSLDYLPPELNGIVTEEDYLEHMQRLQKVLSRLYPFAVSSIFLFPVPLACIIFLDEPLGGNLAVSSIFLFFPSFFGLSLFRAWAVRRVFEDWNSNPTNGVSVQYKTEVKGYAAVIHIKVIEYTKPSGGICA